MRSLHLAHLALTALLLASAAVLVSLLLVGVLEMRRPSATTSSAPADPELRPAAKAAGAKARLLVVRGQRTNWEYPIYEGRNILGRADEQPVDIDLEPLEPADRIWSSRQHAAITWEGGAMTIEDLN